MSADRRPKRAAQGELTPGQHLRAEFGRLGLDQVTVSKATGVSRQSINNIVNDRQPISRAMAGKLARLTGHTSDYWLRATFSHASGDASSKRRRIVPARVANTGVLVNHQIARAVKDGIIGIDPFDEAQVQLASIDLTLADVVLTADGGKVDIGGQAFTLRGGRTVTVSTRERVELPPDYIGRVGATPGLASRGIVTSHGLHLDPGFNGHLRLCLFNASGRNFELRSGMPIVSVEIVPLGVAPVMERAAARRLAK